MEAVICYELRRVSLYPRRKGIIFRKGLQCAEPRPQSYR